MKAVVRDQLTYIEIWAIIRQVPDECVLECSNIYLLTTVSNHL